MRELAIEEFDKEEKLYRRVPSKPTFWKEDGTISSAAFKDSKGASVDRQMHRSDLDSVNFLLSKCDDVQSVVSVTYGACVCENIGALVRYMPIPDNDFHSEIHRNQENVALTQSQAKKLAKISKIERRGA